MMRNKKSLIRKFRSLLNEQSKDENDIQRFLEKNTELIPLPFILNHRLHFKAIISKFKISDSNVTDFAYLTKCSDFWYFVLIELESPKKKIFAKKGDVFVFHHNFNNSYDQILYWKSHIEENKENIAKKVKRILVPLRNNPVKFKYVLIYGRSKEKDNSDIKKRLLTQKNTSDIRVLTYDSLVSEFINNPYPIQKNILSHWRQGFKIKYLNNLKTHIFAYVIPEYLKITDEHKEVLKNEGYDIDSWEKGKLLQIGDKYPLEKYKQVLDNKIIGGE